MKIWDVLKELAGNPELTFKNLRFGGVIGHKESGILAWISGSDRIGEAFTIHHIDDGIAGGNWNDDWELVPQEVTWQEAIQAWLDGKSILIKHNGSEYTQSGGNRLGCFTDNPFAGFGGGLFREGKWFIG